MNLTKIIGDNENIRKYRVTGAMMDKIKVFILLRLNSDAVVGISKKSCIKIISNCRENLSSVYAKI